MASYFDLLQRASFDGIEFPYLELGLEGGARVGVHKARFRPGAELESHARESYKASIVGIFDSKVRGYGDLLEKRIALRKKFDLLVTAELTIPIEGTFRAKAVAWKVSSKPSVSRSGVMVEMSFLEDSTNVELLTGKAPPANTITIPAAAVEVREEAEALDVSPDFMAVLEGAIDSCLEAKAMVEGQAYLAEGKIRSVTEVLRQIDNTAKELQSPESWQLVQAIHQLGGAMVELSETLGATTEIRTFVVPKTMSVQELSQAIFKDTMHVQELLNLNPAIEDASEVPAGLTVRYLDGG